LPVHEDGAQRASFPRSRRLTAFALVATLLVGLGALATPAPASAAGIKVVIVVGPVGSSTNDYRDSAREYARVARAYGAKVVELYTPYATWSRVKQVAQGANLFIYLGHGNGYPSPYGAFSKYTRNGLGLNREVSTSNSNVKYWGEFYIDRDLQLAPNAVVILNRLCYASGNSEWGHSNPTKSTAIQRADGYGAGFLRAGARVVFAHATESARYTMWALFRSERTMDSIFMAHPDASGARDFRFDSSRTPGKRAHMDPPKSGKYWRSVVGDLSMKASEWRAGAS
jgi:hypothetical protein